MQNRLRNGGAPIGGRKIGRDVAHPFGRLNWHRAGSRNYLCTGVTQHLYDGCANTSRAAGDKRTVIGELKVETHGMISSAAILPRSRRKQNRRSTGLPGKFPVNRLVTTVMPSFCSKAKGSLV